MVVQTSAGDEIVTVLDILQAEMEDMLIIQGYDAEEDSIRIHGQVIGMDVVVVLNLSEQAGKRKTESALNDGSDGYRYCNDLEINRN